MKPGILFVLLLGVAVSGWSVSKTTLQSRLSSHTAAEAPPPSSTVSFTQILDEMGSLENQESGTLAQQEQAELNAIKMQAGASTQAAKDTLKASNAMMMGAVAGLALNMTSAGLSFKATETQEQALNEEANVLISQASASLASGQIALANQQMQQLLDLMNSEIAAAGSVLATMGELSGETLGTSF